MTSTNTRLNKKIKSLEERLQTLEQQEIVLKPEIISDKVGHDPYDHNPHDNNNKYIVFTFGNIL